jgi:hypothetical protein
MAKRVVVTAAQKEAARAMVERSSLTGRSVSKSVHQIANAKVQHVSGGQPPPTSA